MKKLIIILFVAILAGCTYQSPQTSEKPNQTNQSEPLPSWNDTPTRTSIMNFVSVVCNPDSKDFIPESERIAVFDNDGNLWSEQPMYFQLAFTLDRIELMAEDHPEWKDQQPFKAAIEGDIEAIAVQGEKALLELLMASHSGMSSEEFTMIVKDWLAKARHPRFNRAYTNLVYQPMLELLDYLRDNGFKTYIVSGGGIDFMRPWTEEVYGIPPEQVVGSMIDIEFVYDDTVASINRMPGVAFIDDKEGKPIGIHRFIGRRPVFCSGNSDGDLAMMRYTASGKHKSFMLYLHHTDADREWAYDRESHIGKLDKGLDEAIARSWTIVDMKKDWKVIYPFELD